MCWGGGCLTGKINNHIFLTYVMKPFSAISKIFHSRENLLVAGFYYFYKVLWGNL